MDCKFISDPVEPRIWVTPEAMQKMRYFIDNIDVEIGWLGYVSRNDLDFIIEDVFLVKQRVHAATTELDPVALTELATELISQGEEGAAKYNSIRVWGHSHVNMSPTPSGQDNEQMNDFANDDYFIRLIGNKKGEWNISLWDYANNILWTGLEMNYWFDTAVNENDLKTQMDTLVSRIATQTTPKTSYFNKDYFSNRYGFDYDDYDVYDYPYYGSSKKNLSERLKEEEIESLGVREIKGQDKILTDRDIREIIDYYDLEQDIQVLEVLARGDMKTAIDDILYVDWGIEDLYPYYWSRLQEAAKLALTQYEKG